MSHSLAGKFRLPVDSIMCLHLPNSRQTQVKAIRPKATRLTIWEAILRYMAQLRVILRERVSRLATAALEKLLCENVEMRRILIFVPDVSQRAPVWAPPKKSKTEKRVGTYAVEVGCLN